MNPIKNTRNYISITIIAMAILLCSVTLLNAQGPKAPEAGAFEPVDATDMVNLLTGDLAYVMPLLEVPSPEGGYPLALSYHGAIAMEQQASWVGLGWSLNPGAINRNVNGYPDDWNAGENNEFFYDQGGTLSTTSISLGYGVEGVYSVGFSFSLGDNMSFGANAAYGALNISLSSEQGASVGLGYKGVGLNIGTNGYSISANNKLGNISVGSNGVGFQTGAGSLNVSYHSNSGFSVSESSTGISFSHSGSGFRISAGTGFSVSFNQTTGQGDYTIKQSGFTIPIYIPTPIGVFSGSFGKQKIKYFLNENKYNLITGPVNFYKDINSLTVTNYEWEKCIYNLSANIRQASSIPPDYYFGYEINYCNQPIISSNGDYVFTCFYDECSTQITNESTPPDQSYVLRRSYLAYVKDAFMDVYEFPVEDQSLIGRRTNLDDNNVAFPNYDNFNITAQGISGTMRPRLFENGALIGLNKEDIASKYYNSNFDLNYTINGESTNVDPVFKFNHRPEFSLENEFSSYLETSEATYNFSTINNDILDYSNANNDWSYLRKKGGTHIEYFTNEELYGSTSNAEERGYLKPHNSTLDEAWLLANIPDAIGAYTVTAADGKTYHYSLPVINYETITRSHGMTFKPEDEMYFEQSQLEPYATHWLLTAITGPDFIDVNSNGYPDESDYGYWTRFEYGKWSDAFVWKTPYGKDYNESLIRLNSDTKTVTIGRKQVYYLDKIKTRTHTALFVKNTRNDAKSYYWDYKSVNPSQNQNNSSDFVTRFTVPSQKQLRLDKIILLRNQYDTTSKSSGNGLESTGTVNINFPGRKQESGIQYNIQDNVLDVNDNMSGVISNSLKVIDFSQHYTYELAKNSPNSDDINQGRLTLKGVTTQGKSGVEVVPPYTFNYNNAVNYDVEQTNAWGYHRTDIEAWSLNQITTPTGGKIKIEYEDQYTNSVIKGSLHFVGPGRGDHLLRSFNFSGGGSNNRVYTIESKFDYGFKVGDTGLSVFETDEDCNGVTLTDEVYEAVGTIIEDLSTSDMYIYKVQSTGTVTIDSYPSDCGDGQYTGFRSLDIYYGIKNPLGGSGIRVSKIKLEDEVANTYITNYGYNDPSTNKTSGYITYIPFHPDIGEELPYSRELPAPKPMYEYVTIENTNANGESLGKTVYHQNVLKNKTTDAIEFEEFFKIDVIENNFTNSTSSKFVDIKQIDVKDNLAAIGKMLDVSFYNKEGQLLTRTSNEYYGINEFPNDQGIMQESFQTYKEVDYENDQYADKWLINSSTRRVYASALKSSIKLENGFEMRSDYITYDPITGNVLESTIEDSKGNYVRSQSIPAYTIPEYSSGSYSMASKGDGITNKNMLTQEAMNKTYYNIGGQWKETNVNIMTWNNEWYYRENDGTQTSYPNDPIGQSNKVWRKHKTFVWDGSINMDGTYQNFVGEDDNFNWAVASVGNETVQSNSKWENTTTNTLYDHFGMLTEFRDINNNHATTKMTDNHTKVAFTSNAKFGEAYSSGAEYVDPIDANYLDQGVKGANYRSTTKAHTGQYSLRVKKNYRGFETVLWLGQHDAQKYKISVWVDAASVSKARIHINGQTKTFNGEAVPAGDWVQLNHYEDLQSANETLYITSQNNFIYIDDFRIHPISSSMTTYVYNEWEELTHIIGNNGLAIKYEYDSEGRLTKTYTEIVDDGTMTGGFKLINETNYNYKNQ